jgi:hypothetical protein
MKTLDRDNYKGTIHRSGKFPREIIFDNLTDEDIPFIEMIGLGYLVKEVKTNPKEDAKKAVEAYMGKPKRRTRKKK